MATDEGSRLFMMVQVLRGTDCIISLPAICGGLWSGCFVKATFCPLEVRFEGPPRCLDGYIFRNTRIYVVFLLGRGLFSIIREFAGLTAEVTSLAEVQGHWLFLLEKKVEWISAQKRLASDSRRNMGLHSPLSPRQKIFFSQWPVMDGRGFEPVGSLLNQPDSSSTSAQQYVAHEDVQIVPTALCPESKKEEEMTNCSVTREISKLRGEGRSVLQSKSCYTESQCLRTPCFTDTLAAPSFLAAESPLCLSAGSLSPILLLSPLRKSSGVDLSMYLPENFTPATTEALESSFDGGMFQFPAVSSRESPSFEMDVDTQESERENLGTDVVGKLARTDVAPAGPSCQHATKVEMDFGNSLGQTQIEFSRLFFDCSSRWTSTDSDDLNMEYESSDEDTDNATRNSFAMKSVEFPKRAKPVKADDRDKEISVSTRNKLERDRRRNMNSKLEKLRQIVPEISKNKRASKVMILNKAAEYVKELSVTESTLFDRKAAEKARNETLVRKLVQLTSNM